MINLFQRKLAQSTPPGIIISSQIALNMIDGYRTAHQTNPNHTIYADFGHEKFTNFMNFFGDADGIRIYNARTATGQDCFIFVPIKNVSTTDTPCWVECDPIEIDVDNDGIVDTNFAAFNFGTLCPPANGCNCACDGVHPNRLSFARQVYGNLICPPPAPQP
jgi:hypothetical protein